MSRSITALGQHTLPFLDKKEMMLEISKRFEANVFLGFFESYGLAKNKLSTFKSRGLINPEEGSRSGELYLLEEVLFSESAPNFLLIEEDYEYQWLFEEFGENAGFKKEFVKVWTKDPIENNRIIQDFINEFRIIDFYFKDIAGLLSLESADVGLKEYFTGWTNFFGLICRQDYQYPLDFYESLFEYRSTNRETIIKMGGKCIYYHDDQGKNTGLAVQGNEWDMTWKEIEHAFNLPDIKEYHINLCEALTNPEYLKLITKKTKNNFHDYSVFFDDLRPLSWDEIIKP